MMKYLIKSFSWLAIVFWSTAGYSQAVPQGNHPKALITVDWNRVVKRVEPLAYGVNCPACFDPVWGRSPALLRPLGAISAGGKPLIRLHGWGMVSRGSNECWLNQDGTWNTDKIKSALTPLAKMGYTLMIDIPSGPGGEQDPLDPAAMARFASALVKIVNVDNKFDVKYWEIPNEREHILTAAKMATLVSRASVAMKQVDPTILVGGPATEGINVDYIADVVKQSLQDIDFVTAHTYGGDGKQPDSVSFKSALKAVDDVRRLRERLTAQSQEKYLPIFLDEYNIGWDMNPRIHDNRGAVYFSIIAAGVVDAGGDASAVWDFSPPHDMSIVDRNGNLNVSANIVSLMNRYCHGDEVAAMSSNPTLVRIYAVKSASARSVVISNLSESPSQVRTEFHGLKSRIVNIYQISHSGYRVEKIHNWRKSHRDGVNLPAMSVTVLVF
jgi:hypothetical protein